MIKSPPLQGQIIRFDYLWHREHKKKQEFAVKDRPCLIVGVEESPLSGLSVTLLPISTEPELVETDGIKLPDATKIRLKMSADESYVTLVECNKADWPNDNVKFIPYRKPRTHLYGVISQNVFDVIRNRYLANKDLGRVLEVPRPNLFEDKPEYRKGRWSPEVK